MMGRTISANCESQKAEDVNAAEAEKGPTEDQSVFRRHSYYRVLFFFLKILAAELQNSYTSMLKLNARVASQSLEIRFHFQLKSKRCRGTIAQGCLKAQ